MYEPRTYRNWIQDKDLVSFNIIVKETDLHVRSVQKLESEAVALVRQHRQPIEDYILTHPLFLSSLQPCPVEPDAPHIIREMAEAAKIAGVGPMAAVAGAIAEAVGHDLLAYSSEVIVENGGDIFIKISKKRKVGIFAGESSPFTGKLALEINPEDTPLGICTSSGMVGHSLSFGQADAVVVVAKSTSLADAVATAVGNKIRSIKDIDKEIETGGARYGIDGLLILKDDRIGLWGNLKLVS